MSFWDKLRGELIDIIEWIERDRETIVWRFPRYDNEIKNGAKLIVRESQMAAVINEGMLTDLFMHPGTYELTTKNLPILSTIRGWKYGFSSPFKAEVYFVSLKTFTDRKWGTKNPIMLRDPEFGPVRLRAFGNFAIKVSDPATLLKNLVGTDGRFTIDEINDQLRDMMVGRFADVLGASNIAALDLAGNYDQLSKFMIERIDPDFEQFGLRVASLVIENISFPPEVEAALDKRTSMGVIGDLNKYTQYQAAASMEAAAKNPGGAAGAGMGLGAGIGMAGAMASAMNQANQPQSTPAQPAQTQPAQTQPAQTQPAQAPGAHPVPPPLPQVTNYHVVINGQQSGPFDVMKFPQLIAAGQVTRESFVWKPGMANWARAADMPDLGPMFSASPPPVPGQ